MMKCPVFVFLSILLLSIYSQAAAKVTEADVEYGKHERNKLDLWKAKSSKPTPVLIFFHGGGFKMGDKKQVNYFFSVDDYLKKGVSCITINYPFLKHTNNNYLAIMKHCQDAISFIKKNASKWNIDPKRMSTAGTSAGALIAQYLAYNSKDISAVGAFMQPVGTEFFVIPNIKKSSPPLMIYQQNPLSDKIHHPKYAQMVKDACDKHKCECYLYGTGKNGIPKIPGGKNQKQVMMKFFLEKWGIK